MNELRAYADGRWAAFSGLEHCSLSDVDDVLGPRLSPQLTGGMFGGEPTQFTRYAGGSASPEGLTAWVLGDVVVGLEIRQPTPFRSALDELGSPPDVIGSELGRGWRQELWPDRGLVLHRRDEVIAVALGLAPFTLRSWESDPLRWWRVERRAMPS